MTTVLVADDDLKLSKLLERLLRYEGFNVLAARDGRETLAQVRTGRPDVIVLDWRMPEVTGIEVVRHLRGAGDRTPVLMISALSAVEDRVEGLNAGADDYLAKPFALSEMLARVRALLRRPGLTADDATLAYADLRLEPAARRAERSGRPIELSGKEFELLRCLLRHSGHVLGRDQIVQEVWGYDFDGEANVLEVYIGYLRKKTEAAGETRLIQTVRGVGYVLRDGRARQ